MTRAPVAFACVVICLGLGSAIVALANFRAADLTRFFIFLGLGLVAASQQIGMPPLRGVLSLNFLFVLIGLPQLSLGENMTIALAATLVQSRTSPQPDRRWVQTIFHLATFHLATVAIAVQAAHFVFGLWKASTKNWGMLVPHFLAAVVYYVLSTFPLSAMLAFETRQSLLATWKECYRWSLPFYLAGGLVAVAAALSPDLWTTALTAPFLLVIFWYYRGHLARCAEEKNQAQELVDLHQRTIEALALAIEAKDHSAQDHLFRLQTYALAIGQELKLDKSELDALRAASLLHDIGKLAVPDHILSKPGRLSREELEKMRIHPVIGAEILEMVKFPYPVAEIVRHHHEKWNGGGYPDGLAGEKIPLGSRILAVVDAFDSMSSPRPYRPAMSVEEAMRQIVAESGISFDPKVVQIFQQGYPEFERQFQERRQQRMRLSSEIRGRYTTEEVREPSDNKEPEENASFLKSIAAAHQEAQMLFELAQELGSSLSLDETLSVFAVRIRRAIPYDAIAIYVLRDSVLRPEFVAGDNLRLFAQLEIPVGQGLSGWVAANRKPALNGNPLAEPGYREDSNRHETLRSALSVPLEGVNGLVGVLSLYCASKDAFSRDHLRILQAICGKVALSIENALKYRQAESSASTDYLTGLLNARSLFLHLDGEIARCKRLEHPLAVLVSDLDSFKQVNDRFGHLEGNRLLQRVAQKLKENCREYDCVARMGGDEFVMVLPGLSKEGVRKLIPRLREVVKQAGLEVLQEDVIDFSVGEAYYPMDGVNAEQLLAEADRRMYLFKAQAKLAKKCGFDFDRPALSV
ncbi:MAG: diguanylate cyclase [Bryobacteraceae bacterium]|nr:diguanylate cyclase [Bryobacteraceae bacterium]MDW8378130.1 diguanylate cyclase [Bryobacterales bacterium]